MSDIIEKLKNYKIDIPTTLRRKKILSIKKKHPVILKKIKYLSENSNGKFVVKEPRYIRAKQKVKPKNQGV